jgi:hypothetical protein
VWENALLTGLTLHHSNDGWNQQMAWTEMSQLWYRLLSQVLLYQSLLAISG